MTAQSGAPQHRSRLQRRFSEFILGPPFARRLALSHACDDFGDAMVNLSLVNSLFLSVSLDASRSRIMIYLLLTAAPLAMVAPLVGNVLDRTRLGYRFVISGSQLVRAAVSLALIGSLLTVALYPLAFVVLLSRNVYALAKTTMLSQMTDDPRELLRSDAHIGRTGTLVGGVGTAIGGVLLATGHITPMLLIAAPAYTVAALLSRTLPSRKSLVPIRAAPTLRDAIPPRLWSATLAVTAVRAAAGALTYLLAFAMKHGGADTWIFAAALMAAGGGRVVANLLATRIHSMLDPDWVLVLSLLVPGVICALGVLTVGNFGVLAIAFSIGLGHGAGTRTITILNATVPLLARARTIARSELLFQVATLVGAILAVQFAPAPNTGFAASSVVLIAAGTTFGFHRRLSLRQNASRLLLGEHAPAIDRTLPDALLAEARRLASLGAYRMAVVVTAASIDVLTEREPRLTGTPVYARWHALAEHLAAVRSKDEQPSERLVIEVLALAETLIDSSTSTARRGSTERPRFL